MSFLLLQDGTSHLLLQDGSGALLLQATSGGSVVGSYYYRFVAAMGG